MYLLCACGRGGSEYAQVYGMVPDQEAQRSVIDFDPVTGRALRTSVRQQVCTCLSIPPDIAAYVNCILPMLW